VTSVRFVKSKIYTAVKGQKLYSPHGPGLAPGTAQQHRAPPSGAANRGQL